MWNSMLEFLTSRQFYAAFILNYIKYSLTKLTIFQDPVHVSLTGPPGPSVVVDVDNQELKPEVEAVTTTVDVNHNKLQIHNHVVETVVRSKAFLNIATKILNRDKDLFCVQYYI